MIWTPTAHQRAAKARETGILASADPSSDLPGQASLGSLWITGQDAASFLHSQTTNDAQGLAPGEGHLTARVTRKARLVQIFSLHRAPDDSGFIAVLDRAGVPELLQAFDQFLFADRVTLKDTSESWSWWLLQGPQSADVIAEVFPSLPDLAEHDLRWIPGREAISATQKPCIIRRSLTGEPGILIGLPTQDDQQAVRDALQQSAIQHDLLVLSAKEAAPVLEILRIEAGLVRQSADVIGRRILPETGLEHHAVSYTKGCYLGQEVIARVRTYGSVPYALRGLIFDDVTEEQWPSFLQGLPEPGEDLLVAGTKVGQITSRTVSPVLSAPVAFAYLQRAHRTPGTSLAIETHQGTVTARVALLPFYRAPDRASQVQFLYDRAVRVFAEGHEDTALGILEQALRLDSTFAEGYETIGVILGRAGRYHEAIDFFRRLEEIAPHEPMVNTNLSLYYMKIGDKATAEVESAKALQKNLQTGDQSAAEIAAEQDERRRADAKRKRDMFSRVLQIDPVDPIALFGLGVALSTLGEWTTAADTLAQAVASDPKNSAVWLARGKALEALQSFPDAMAVYRQGMDVASQRGDLMPLKEMEHRYLLLSATTGGT